MDVQIVKSSRDFTEAIVDGQHVWMGRPTVAGCDAQIERARENLARAQRARAIAVELDWMAAEASAKAAQAAIDKRAATRARNLENRPAWMR